MQDKKSSRDRPKQSSETKTTSGSKKRDRKSRTSRSLKPKVSAKPIKSEPIDIEPYKTNSKDEFKGVRVDFGKKMPSFSDVELFNS